MADVRNIELKNEQVERVCLAAMVQFPELISDLSRWDLKPSVFSHSVHQSLYSGIIALSNKGPVDPYLLSSHLSSLGITKINDVSIHQYIEECLVPLPISKDSFHSFFEELVKYYYSRQADTKCAKLRVEIRKNLEKPFNEVMGEIEKGFSDIATLQVSNIDQDFVDVWADGENVIKGIADRETPMGILSPFKSFNDMYGMLTFGDAYVFAAQKKTGKSTFLTYWAGFLAKDPKTKVIYFDSEMESWRQICRNISAATGEKEVYYRNGTFKDDKNKVSKAQKVFDEWGSNPGKFFHVYAARKTVQEVESIVRRFHARHIKEDENLICVYDYVKCTGEVSENKPEWLLMGDKMNTLKELASNLPRTIVLTAVQLNEQDKIAMSARISWYCSSLFYLKKKTPDQLQRHGLEFGNMFLEEYCTRSQGEFYDEWVEAQQGGESKFFKNAINLKSQNFHLEDLGTFKEMVKKIEKRGGQLVLADSRKKDYGKIAESAEF